jgi:aspartyl aminopeptidase
MSGNNEERVLSMVAKGGKGAKGAKRGSKSKKKKGKKSKLEEKLKFKPKTGWDDLKAVKEKKIYKFCEDYKEFLDTAKTEREAIQEIIIQAEANKFKSIDKVKSFKAGTRLYILNRNKSIALAILGTEPITNGLNIIASHIDAPRLDLKQNPLYEHTESKTALLRTHYYGGIKKYQWVNIPLAIHGKVILAKGSELEIKIGEHPSDPVFIIPDLLPHLYRQRQAKRRLVEGIKGEELNILVGSRPIKEKGVKEKIKLWVLNYLNKTYGMVEEDFISAEFEIVPATKACDVGFDRSMIAAYGQDDRSCAFTSVRSIFDMKIPRRTSLVLLFDKEEIGSEGPSGVKSRFLENAIGMLIELSDKNYRDSMLRKTMENSKALSSDVNAGINPIFSDVHEKQNAARMSNGIVLTKFTGSGGKSGSNDASAEFMGYIRQLMNKHKVLWQVAELGKVDEGGGGTVAKFIAQHNMDVIDCGPPVLSMHSPMEISSKIDIYSCYEAYVAFLKGM